MTYLRKLIAAFFFGIIVWGAIPNITWGQYPFLEYVYGDTTCRDAGKKIALNDNCMRPGFPVMVGETFSTDRNCATSDIYFIWHGPASRKTYDIGGNDTALSVRPVFNDPSGTAGYIITGITDQPVTDCGRRSRDIFLLRVGCSGSILWLKTFGTEEYEEVGYDVIEATTGDPMFGTSPGDFVIAGWRYDPTYGKRDAYLIRTTSTGTLIWDQTYGDSLTEDYFYSLVEATALPGMLTGDIVAAGASEITTLPGGFNTGLNGLLARVDGNTGAIGIPPQNFAVHGDTLDEEFRSVTDIRASQYPAPPPPPGCGACTKICAAPCNQDDNIVTVGYSRSPDGTGSMGAEVYILMTTQNPAARFWDEILGDQGLSWDDAYSVKEVRSTAGGMPTGNLIVTGRTDITGGHGGDDVFLMELDPWTLIPAVGGFGIKLFGGIDDDWGWDVAEKPQHTFSGGLIQPPGYIICGFTKSNLANTNPADPEQLYALFLNSTADSPCDTVTVAFANHHTRYPIIAFSPLHDVIDLECDVEIEWVSGPGGQRLCYDPRDDTIPIKNRRDMRSDTEHGIASGDLTTSPNPVKAGELFLVHINLLDKSDSPLAFRIIDTRGREVYRERIEASNFPTSITILTHGWSSGTYIVELTVGETILTDKLVIID